VPGGALALGLILLPIAVALLQRALRPRRFAT
jgi:hypothetical protein